MGFTKRYAFCDMADEFMQAAIEEARKGLAAGGIPIGSVLVHNGKIIGRGHNQRVQHGSVIHHAEMNCLENAGRQRASVENSRSSLLPRSCVFDAGSIWGKPRY